MLVIKMADERDDGVWFDYEGAEEVKFCIRQLGAAKFEEIKGQFSKKVVRKNGIEIKVNEQGFQNALIDYILCDWNGLVTSNGTKLDVTKEHKLIVMDNLDISTFIWESSKKLEEIEVDELEDEKKT